MNSNQASLLSVSFWGDFWSFLRGLCMGSVVSAAIILLSPVASGSTRSIENQSPMVGRSEVPVPSLDGTMPKSEHITLGLGPFIPYHLESDSILFGLDIGYSWDIDPTFTFKLGGQAAFSSEDDGARFFNLGPGVSYFFPGVVEAAPYVTADVGYGLAESGENRDAEGFSMGAGLGFQFLRNTSTTLDLLLKYSLVLNDIGVGNPAIIGARLALNF